MALHDPLEARFPKSFGYVASVRKKAIRLRPIRADDAMLAVGSTKMGGDPDLAAAAEWPIHGERPMSFVAQIRLDEVAGWDDDALLPREGLLLFFVDDATDVSRSAGVDGMRPGRVLHLEGDPSRARRSAQPPFDEPGRSYPACAVELVPVPSFPQPAFPFFDVDALAPKERDEYAALLRELGTGHQLLGYPSSPDRAHDRAHDREGRLDGDSRLLLELDPDTTLGFPWTKPVFFIGQDPDLRSGGFRRVRILDALG